MLTRTRQMTVAAALALPLALLGCGREEAEEPVSGGVEEAEQFDQAPGGETGDEQQGDEASEEGQEEPATAPQVGAEE